MLLKPEVIVESQLMTKSRPFPPVLKRLRQHLAFGLVLVLYFISAFAYSRTTPLWETPDEPSHFAYVRYIQQHGGPPIQSFQEGKNEVETGHHPPLYYYLGTWLVGDKDLSDFKKLEHNPYFSFANNDGGINVFRYDNLAQIMPNSFAAGYTLRQLSILFGAGTLISIYLSGLLFFGKSGSGLRWQWADAGRIPATLGAVLVGLLPQFDFLSGAINNDNAVIFFCAATFYGCLRLLLDSQPPAWWKFALLGGIVGLGMLAKYNEIAYIPLVALVIGITALQKRSWGLFIKGALISSGVCLAICGWWFVRAQILYGDPAGWGMWRSSFASIDQSASFKWTGYNLHHIWDRWFTSFWGVFGWMNISFEPEVYSYCAWIMLLAGVGLGLLTLDVIQGEGSGRGKASLTKQSPSSIMPVRRKQPTFFSRTAEIKVPDADNTTFCLIFVALSVGLVLTSGLNYAVTFGDAGTQGRYLFPMLPAFGLGTAAGLIWLAGLLRYVPGPLKVAQRQKIANGLSWTVIGLAVAGLGYLNVHAINERIIPSYTVANDLSLKTLPTSATVSHGGEFGPGMWLAGYEVQTPTKTDQNPVYLKLTLYWRVRNTTSDNWVGFVHLYNSQGRDIGQQNGPPGQGHYQTYMWKKGDLVKDERTIAITGSAWKEVFSNRTPLQFQFGWVSSLTGQRALITEGGGADFYFNWNW